MLHESVRPRQKIRGSSLFRAGATFTGERTVLSPQLLRTNLLVARGEGKKMLGIDLSLSLFFPRCNSFFNVKTTSVRYQANVPILHSILNQTLRARRYARKKDRLYYLLIYLSLLHISFVSLLPRLLISLFDSHASLDYYPFIPEVAYILRMFMLRARRTLILGNRSRVFFLSLSSSDICVSFFLCRGSFAEWRVSTKDGRDVNLFRRLRARVFFAFRSTGIASNHTTSLSLRTGHATDDTSTLSILHNPKFLLTSHRRTNNIRT